MSVSSDEGLVHQLQLTEQGPGRWGLPVDGDDVGDRAAVIRGGYDDGDGVGAEGQVDLAGGVGGAAVDGVAGAATIPSMALGVTPSFMERAFRTICLISSESRSASQRKSLPFIRPPQVGNIADSIASSFHCPRSIAQPFQKPEVLDG